MFIALVIFLVLSAVSHLFGLLRCADEDRRIHFPSSKIRGYGGFDFFTLIFNVFMMIGAVVLATVVIAKL
jgi:hypothetical protein